MNVVVLEELVMSITKDPKSGELREPLSINDKHYVELFSYGQVNPTSHTLMEAENLFAGRIDLQILEVGVLRGHNAENMHRVLNPKMLVLVDPWEIAPNSLEYHDCNWAETYYRVQGKENIIVIKAKSEVASNILNLGFDLIYVDGDHADIEKDLEVWWPKMRKGGIFAGHYYNYDNIKKAVHDFFSFTFVYTSPYHPHGGMEWWVFT